MYLGAENYLGPTAYLGASSDPDTPTIPLGTLAVTVGGITFASPELGDWCIQQKGLKGWFDGSPVRADAPQRPGQHGQFGLPAYRDGRSIGLTVWCQTRSDAEVGAAVDAITGLLADGGYDTITVTRPDGQVTHGVVRINGQPLVETFGWQTVSAQVELWSPEPFRYGPLQQQYTTLPEIVGGLRYPLYTDGTVSTGRLQYGPRGSLGRVTLTNTGNAPGSPSFEVRGPAPQGFTIKHVETGRRIVSATVIPAGSSLTINTDSGSATLDGVDRSGQLTVREWPTIPPGDSATFAFTAPVHSAASLVASVRPTYW